MTRLADVGEFGFIKRVTDALPRSRDDVAGPGDDCAVLRWGAETLLVTCDLSIEDVHFRRANTRAEDIGWKAIAVSLSDIAAMGGVPKYATVSLAAPFDTELAVLDGIVKGMREAAEFGGAAIVGGDTTRSPRGIIIDTTVIGDAPGGRYVARKGAREGDVLMVTGSPGDGAAGFHAQEHGHDAPELMAALRRPTPRVAEGQWLREQRGVHGMLDVSDGLAQDAGHLAEAAGMGVDIARDRLPLGGKLSEYCGEFGLNPTEFALIGGEAYELALAVDAEAAEELGEAFRGRFDLALTAVGRFTAAFTGVRVDGVAMDALGFDHFRGV